MQRSFATLKSETTIAELARRLFDIRGAKGSRAQKIAEAALLRANPELAEGGAFKPGRIIVVPSDTGLKPTDWVVEPKGGIEGALKDTAMRLKLAGQLLDDQFEKEAKEAEKTLAKLDDNSFIEKLKKAVPESARLIPKTRKSIQERAASDVKIKADYTKVLEQAAKELERLTALAKRDE